MGGFFRPSGTLFGGGFFAPLTPPPQYSFSASFLEIYNEALRDLLGGDKGGELEIRHVSSASKELHVPNLRCVPVASEDEVRSRNPPLRVQLTYFSSF